MLIGRATGLHAQQPEAREVRKISFEGTHNFGDELLRAAIISNPTSCTLFVVCNRSYVDEIGLRGDLVRLRLFYFQRGFRNATVALDTLKAGDGLEIRFKVTEGEPVVVSRVAVIADDTSGIDGPTRSALRRALPLRVNDVFNLLEYEAARDTLRARLANLGYARSEVLANYLIPRDTATRAHVQFDVLLGDRVRFGPVTVQGNQSVSSAVVERMLTFQPGQHYSYQQVLRSQRNLFGLETFRHVEIRADPNATTDTIVPVTVQVNEADLHRVRVGVGLSTAEFINAEARWTSRNFGGGARRMEVRGRLYNVLAEPLHEIPGFEETSEPYSDLSGSLSADFSQPWFFSPLNTFGAGIYAERRSLPDIFVRTGRGAYVSLLRSLGPGSSITVGYRPEVTKLTAGGDLVFCVNFVACGEDEIEVLREPHWLSPLALAFVRDRSNSLFAPTRGHIIRLESEYAARLTGSDFSYTRISAEATRYGEPFRGVVLATRLRPGWARSLSEPGEGLGLHPQKRFFGGGPNSVRGFAQFRMGPKLLTINAVDHLAPDSANAPGSCTAQQINVGSCDVSGLAEADPQLFDVRAVGGAAVLEGNFELRVPFFLDKMRAAAFVDFGQVWRDAQSANLKELVFTPGFGFRYFSAIGPVRIDIGYNPQAAERLTVVTNKVCVRSDDDPEAPCTPDSIQDGVVYTSDQLDNTRELVTLGNVRWGADRSFFDRLQFHFSIGQAF
ncbi:MAG TPA: BamA/TamA family outer membrane protein [Longimicrobiales bacterium]